MPFHFRRKIGSRTLEVAESHLHVQVDIHHGLQAQPASHVGVEPLPLQALSISSEDLAVAVNDHPGLQATPTLSGVDQPLMDGTVPSGLRIPSSDLQQALAALENTKDWRQYWYVECAWVCDWSILRLLRQFYGP